MSIIPLQHEIHYPESDGQPMGETPEHIQVLMDLIHALNRRYADVPNVYVWGNMMFYYVQGDPRSCVSPDVFLVKGIDKQKQRRTYKLWEEKVPCLVIEATSESSRQQDQGAKKDLYERLGVEEYFLFDPLGEYLRPRLQGYRLVNRRYQRQLPAADGSLESRTIGCSLTPEGHRLRLRDSQSGTSLPWASEEAEARRPPKSAPSRQPARRPPRSALSRKPWPVRPPRSGSDLSKTN